MCGRYWIDADEDWLSDYIEALNRSSSVKASSVKTSGEIFPADTVPVIASSKSMQPTPFFMQWGYSLPGGRKVINARSETAAQSVMFADGMAQRRLLIPASRYFEWAHRGREKVKYAIRPEAGGKMFMAGVYRFEGGRPVFSILTRVPGESIAFIHNRMPVILPEEMVPDWLNPRHRADEVLACALTDMHFEAMEQQCLF